MKWLLVSAACLAVGIGLGWYAGHSAESHKTSAAVDQMLETIESADAAQAARNVRVITLIESGETQGAIRSLCTPIANYYDVYAVPSNNDNVRSKVRTLIQELVRTNNFVAQEITNHMVSTRLRP